MKDESKKQDDFRVFLQQNNVSGTVTIFGCGYVGKIVMYLCKYIYNFRIRECLDNNEKRTGELFWNDIVCKIPQDGDVNTNVLIAINDDKIVNKIENQCLSIGYKNVYKVNEDLIFSAMNELSDRECVYIRYYARTGQYLNLERPITFNEKLQWLKVYDYKPIYNTLTDKLAAKEYIGSLIGEEHIIPTIGIWDSFDDIDFSTLPKYFVLKCSHDSGSAEIILDKDTIDKISLKKKYDKTMSRDYYWAGREHGYKGIPRKIIAEPKLNRDSKDDVKDYKVFCFDGVPKLIQVDYGRFHNHTRVMYSTEWEPLGFSTCYPYGGDDIESKPDNLNKLLELASVVSAGISHVRADFYLIDNKIYFGEMTFHHGSGCERFSDEEWNYRLGEYLKLPEKSININD